MSVPDQRPGFYGKLPILGDFVSRRLPRQFIGPWDQWLQSGLSASREQLDEQWLEIYLTSPIWRFGLSPGLCGPGAWAGILMPSVDRVGRYFPLTVAAPIDNPSDLIALFEQGPAWFDPLETLALSALEDGLDLASFDQALQDLGYPAATVFHPCAEAPGAPDQGRFALCVGMDGMAQVSSALAGIGGILLQRFLPTYSLWGTHGSERVGASLLVCENLPPIEGFTSLMTGCWDQRGWDMKFKNLFGFRNTAADLPKADNPSPAGPDTVLADSASGHWRWHSHGISVVGNHRKVNEDAMLERSEEGLWVVADGMGGHRAGDVASGSIVEALSKAELPGDLQTRLQTVSAQVVEVNRQLHALAAETADRQIVGSTIVVLMAQKHRCAVAWAGDSRLYRYRDGQLEQLTRDHSLQDEWAEFGFPDGDPPPFPVNSNIITRAVGAEPDLDLEVLWFEAAANDVFLLCSDGLTKELNAEEIAALLLRETCEAEACALIDAALLKDGRDNITVIVVRPEIIGNGR